MRNIDAIAGASARTESLHFGSGDFAASIGAPHAQHRRPASGYGVLADADESGIRAYHWTDMWHYPLMRMIVAARAHGLRPIDGPFADSGMKTASSLPRRAPLSSAAKASG